MPFLNRSDKFPVTLPMHRALVLRRKVEASLLLSVTVSNSLTFSVQISLIAWSDFTEKLPSAPLAVERL